MKTDPRVDAYIAKSAELAQPILRHLRSLVHAACPAEETIKWGMPWFGYHGILCGMAGFKDFTPSPRRDYIEWITSAKRPGTRAKQVATTIQWLATGKRRNWQYEKC